MSLVSFNVQKSNIFSNSEGLIGEADDLTFLAIFDFGADRLPRPPTVLFCWVSGVFEFMSADVVGRVCFTLGGIGGPVFLVSNFLISFPSVFVNASTKDWVL
jgi:hypothetical protein